MQRKMSKTTKTPDNFVAVQPFNWNETSLSLALIELQELMKPDVLGLSLFNTVNLIPDGWSTGKYKFQMYVLRFMTTSRKIIELDWDLQELVGELREVA